jgi:glycine cleavage system H protein
VNAALNDSPQTLNQDPHGEGWICKFRLGDPREAAGLMDAAAYEATIAK